MIGQLDAFQLAEAFRERSLSPVEVAREALDRAEDTQSTINAFALIDRQRTLSWAAESEKRWRHGAPLGAFDGVGVTVKDHMAVEGWPCRKGSRVTAPDKMTFNAPVVDRCLEAGLVILGTTTMPEFGWIGLSSSPLTGHTRNPLDLTRTTGGSSAGASASAALGIGRFHLGSDGLGSIRIPSAYCGVVGLKPSYGQVPAYPLAIMGELAHLGPIAPTVRETAALLGIISGPDLRDPTAWNLATPGFLDDLDGDLSGLRVACSLSLGFVEKLDPAVADATLAAARAFERLGATVEMSDPPLEDTAPLIWDIWKAGTAFGLRSFDEDQLSAMDPGLVACARAGRDMHAADLVEALLVRKTRVASTMARFHQHYDLLLTPTMPTGAIPIGADLPPPGFSGVDQWGPLWTDWSPYCGLFNVTQQPAGTVPNGVDGEGMPIGLQIAGRRREDALVLKAMRAFEAFGRRAA
jgi:aspartyl-tRNA(Asn)/glutamyl-tRNA(Gln) amidotransferase subunit A